MSKTKNQKPKKNIKNHKNVQKKYKTLKKPKKIKNTKTKKISKNIKNQKQKNKKIKIPKKIIKTKHKKNNKKQKIKNGNISNIGNLTIISWNKGNSQFLNRMQEIQQIIIEQKPDIFSIQEANLSKNIDIGTCQIDGYKMEVDQLYEKFQMARAVIYINEKIKYTREKEQEVQGEPVIWLKIFTGGNKNFWFQNYYRQWRQIQNDRGIPGTESTRAQALRFKAVTEKWAQLLDTNLEVISVSDTNIDLDKDYEQTQNFQHYEREMIQMHRILVTQIFARGASWIKTPPTKIYPKKKILKHRPHVHK